MVAIQLKGDAMIFLSLLVSTHESGVGTRILGFCLA